MSTSIRGEKRRKRKMPPERKTCALCGRTGTRGFIMRGGLRVCWATPRCMERTLSSTPSIRPPNWRRELAAWERDYLYKFEDAAITTIAQFYK